jgi:hypothetical protein
MMKIGNELLKLLNKKYPPLSSVDRVFGKYDITIKTNSDGDPVLLFIGTRTDQGIIKGDRFVRTLKTDDLGKVIKDHWERKGKAT